MNHFANWYFLFFIPLVIYVFLRRQKKSALKFSSIKLLKHSGIMDSYKHKIGKYIILTGLCLLIFALARPRLPMDTAPVNQKGIDIAIAFDISGSMRSVDFEPNRLEAARKTIENFIDARLGDRISLIIFAGTAHTRIPLTLDHNILKESLREVNFDSVNKDGTAIGMAISVCLNRLKKSDSETKIMILLTDGDNNAGEINPYTASQLAKEMGVRIYTIGVGSDKTIMPYVDVWGRTGYQEFDEGFDEELLKSLAENTNGKYYRAKDPKSLDQIFATIDSLEKSEFQRENFIQYREFAFGLIKIGLIILLIGIFFDKYYYTKIP
ncbi:UNVERIFIED_CONTAM: Ca-activated chloride channel family protein [Acetivibrio alkalicellulosi]